MTSVVRRGELLTGLGPSVVCADNETGQLEQVEPYVSWWHLDYADGTVSPRLYIDEDVADWARATGRHLNFHLLSDTPRTLMKQIPHRPGDSVDVFADSLHPEECAELAQQHGLLMIPVFRAEEVHPQALEEWQGFGYVMVLSVAAGSAGEAMSSAAVRAVRLIHETLGGVRVLLDGGVTVENVTILVENRVAGVVSGSAVFHTDEPRLAARRIAGSFERD